MAEPSESGIPRKKRVESIDAFRGFTIFGMIFVIMVAGYHHLPLTFPHWGSAPVSTFKHAAEDGEPEEWAFYEGTERSTEYHLGEVTARNTDGTYDIVVPPEEETPEGTESVLEETEEEQKVEEPARFRGANVRHAKPLAPGDKVIAVTPDDGSAPRFQGIGNGCTFTDWVAPFFVFIVGICIPLSRQRRGGEWWRHVGIRTLGLIGLGVLYISLILKLSWWWGILQAIGISYFMGAAAMKLPKWGRWVFVAVIALVHGWMSWHVKWWLDVGDPTKPFYTVNVWYQNVVQGQSIDASYLRPLMIHCTPWASISYGLITVAGTLLGDAVVTRDPKTILKQSLLIGVVFSGVGILLHEFQAPMNKDYVSPAYSIFTSGLGALCFLAFYWVIDVWGIRKWDYIFAVFGANALLAYFLQPVVRIFFQALGLYSFFTARAGWNGVLWGLIWTMCLWVVVLWCNKKNIYWKI